MGIFSLAVGCPPLSMWEILYGTDMIAAYSKKQEGRTKAMESVLYDLQWVSKTYGIEVSSMITNGLEV